MASKGKSLKDFGVSTSLIKAEFQNQINGKANLSDLQFIFDFAVSNMDFFPNFALAGNATYKDYIARWVKNYGDAISKLPSKKTAKPKASCSDPAIIKIVQAVTEVDDDKAEEQNKYHNLFMSAENIQGGLLEEYINNNVREFGWIWCAGNILRAVDFVAQDGSMLVQIKNKSNSENSSSSAIRTNTTIKKWYRLGTKSERGEKKPVYKWDDLNSIINAHKGDNPKNCAMSEADYVEFLKAVSSANKNIINDN